jgi:hypothetical protein
MMSETAQSLRADGNMVRVSTPVKQSLARIRDDLEAKLGRQVSYSEVIEHLLARAGLP